MYLFWGVKVAIDRIVLKQRNRRRSASFAEQQEASSLSQDEDTTTSSLDSARAAVPISCKFGGITKSLRVAPDCSIASV